MDGIGSGRTRSWTATTDDYRSSDVRRWNREGWFAPHQSFLVFFHPCQFHNRLRCIPIP